MALSRIAFPNLNGLRFITALMVMLNHIESIKENYGFPNLAGIGLIRYLGTIGVTLFFVLSGFLITYLLFEEKRIYSTISIRNFYIRRVLRIWPLYFLIVLLVFIVLPRISFFQFTDFNNFIESDYNAKFILFLLIIPNLAYVLYSPMPFISPTWSIGVEEQFYLIWPIVIQWTSRYLEILIFISISFFLFSRGLVGDLIEQSNKIFHFGTTESVNLLANDLDDFFKLFRIGCMAIGGLGAYFLFFSKTTILNLIYSNRLQIGLIATLLLSISLSLDVSHEFYALLFMGLIVNLASNPNCKINLNYGWLDYFGKISYGLYMFHSIVIYTVIETMVRGGVVIVGFYSNFILYSMSVLSTILLSHISYSIFEKRFLKLKPRFSKILSAS